MGKKLTYEELEHRIRELAQYQSKYSKSERDYLDQKHILEIVVNELPFWFSVKDKNGKYLLVNKKMAQAHGVPDSAFLNRPTMETPELYAGGLKRMAESDNQVLKTGERFDLPEYPVTSPEGIRWRRLVKVPWKNEKGDILGVITWSEDITERKKVKEELLNYRDHLEELVEQHTAELKRANEQLQRDIDESKQMEDALRESEEKYRSMMEAMDDAAYICSPDYRIAYMNSAMLKRIGYNAIGERCHKVMHGLDETCPWCDHNRVMNGEHVKFEVVSPKDHKTYHVSNSPIFHTDGSTSILIILRDITKIKEIEAQLIQAQKMESVGRLAGGVAHDYNNALSVIIGFTELMIDEVSQENPLRAKLNEVLKAANNAAGITRQLLAFASKQTVAPRRLDLNANVENMLKMLRRLIGEDLELVWLPGTNLWPVMIDPSQVNQILANLCVNARDAISGVGKVIIETKNASFDEAYCADHIGFIPGEFVLLAVSDNGCGMKKEILNLIFEPFFTTKDVDKGTGLGLATVYGIVKQNNGFVHANSEPGSGTTISIYLPRQKGAPVEIKESNTEGIPVGKGETILLVEDDTLILKLAQKILHGLGYTIFTAKGPTEALKLTEGYAGEIHLLVTDVIMPEMDGCELVDRMESIYPDIKHVFMSGYTADIIAHRGVLDEGVHFIHKPFSRRVLATTIRSALDK